MTADGTSLHVVVYADGGSRGNPGVAGWGAIVLDSVSGDPLAFDNGRAPYATNNYAEYQGLVLGLRLAAAIGATAVLVRMDSKLVIEQMNGHWKVKKPELAELHSEASELASVFHSVTYVWVSRVENTQADHLANLAMDGRAPTLLPHHIINGGEITTRQVQPTAVEAVPLPPAERSRATQMEQVEETARLAVRRGLADAVGRSLDLPTATAVATQLRELASAELGAIWDRVPGERWLADVIVRRPISWRRGIFTMGEGQAG